MGHKERFKELLNKQKALIDKAKAEKRLISAAEKDQFDVWQEEIEGLKATLEAENDFSQTQKDWIETPVNNNGPRVRLQGDESSASAPVNSRGRKYRELFNKKTDMGGFKNNEDYFGAIRSPKVDDRLIQIENAARTGSGSDGGFAVPSEMTAVILDGSLETEIVRSRSTNYSMQSMERSVGVFDGTDSTTAIFGFIPTWPGELTASIPQTPKLRGLKLTAKKLALFTEASREIIADGLGFATALEQALTAAIGYSLDEAFLMGDGVGKPLGALKSECLIAVDKEVNQKAGTITYENIVSMISRMLPGSLNNAVWVISETTIPQLMTLAMAVGTAGIAVPALTRSANGQWMLHNIPAFVSEKVPTLGEQGDISLCDFSHYAIGMREEMSLEKSNAPGFLTDSEFYRCIVRVDGMPFYKSPIKRKNGNTVSPFVTLKQRV